LGVDYGGQKKKKVDLRKVLPAEYKLPEELFNVNLGSSTNSTINLCDGLKRKANVLGENFKAGTRVPLYMRTSGQKCLETESANETTRKKSIDQGLSNHVSKFMTTQKPNYSQQIFRPLGGSVSQETFSHVENETDGSS
jgi:hypothetical protein